MINEQDWKVHRRQLLNAGWDEDTHGAFPAWARDPNEKDFFKMLAILVKGLLRTVYKIRLKIKEI